MKKIVFLWLVLSLLLQVQAASVPVCITNHQNKSTERDQPIYPLLADKGVRKPTLLQKAAVRLMERKLHKRLRKGDEGNLKEKRTLGLIALISGIVGLATLFTIPIIGIMLIPTALVTGIIGLSKNTDKRSRTHSIIGIVLGGTAIFLALLFLILILSWNEF